MTILSSNYDIPSVEMVQQVQEKIDPVENTGKGYGLAPIGHSVTVQGVTGQTINIQTTAVYQQGWDYQASKIYMEKAIDDYFLELTKNWENENQIIVRVRAISMTAGAHFLLALRMTICFSDIAL